jgi:predicted transcriptional regulator
MRYRVNEIFEEKKTQIFLSVRSMATVTVTDTFYTLEMIYISGVGSYI